MHKMAKKDKSLMEGTGTLFGMVADRIEKDILNGLLKPGCFLKSSRELAELYHVSKTVIADAIDILEQKQLILRLPRKGYIVKGKSSQKGMLDVLLFAMDRDPGKSSFIAQMLHLPEAKDPNVRMNFTIRLACSQSDRGCDRLGEELLRLEKFGYPDCVVIIPIDFSRKEIEMCLKLPYPVIFLGDFNGGSYSDLKYRQISPVADIAPFVAKYVVKKGWRHIINMIPELTSGIPSEEEENRIFQTEMKKAGIRCSELVIPGKNPHEANFLAPYILEKEKKLIQSADLLYSRWMCFPKMEFPHPELLTGFAAPGKAGPRLRIDYTPLFMELLKEIQNCRKALTKSIIRKVPVFCTGIDSVPQEIKTI